MSTSPPRAGLLLVISSPSGAGKSSIARALLADDPLLDLSVSATTRPPRAGEVDGADYHFVDDMEFERLVAADHFIEWARVFRHQYGTPLAPLEERLASGRDVLFDIDWQGTQQLHAKRPDATVRVFILPPSMVELERRLRARGTDSDEVIASRMTRAAAEISHWAEYDYVLVNDDFDRCLRQVRTILSAERLARHRRTDLVDLTRTLTA